MNTVGLTVNTFANAVTPFSTIGKQAVSQETADVKDEVFPPVEESSNSSPATNNRNQQAEQREQSEQQVALQDRQQQSQIQRQDQQQIQVLASRDREVRAHERAHSSVGGQLTGAPSYTFQRGPDGVSYAVGGEVSISLPSNGGDPESTIAAADQVRRAALAPANPSAQDRSIATTATQIGAEARSQLLNLQVEQQQLEREQLAAERSGEQQLRQDADLEQQDATASDERLAQLRQAARRSSQLGEQLLTSKNAERAQSVGALLDQLA